MAERSYREAARPRRQEPCSRGLSTFRVSARTEKDGSGMGGLPRHALRLGDFGQVKSGVQVVYKKRVYAWRKPLIFMVPGDSIINAIQLPDFIEAKIEISVLLQKTQTKAQTNLFVGSIPMEQLNFFDNVCVFNSHQCRQFDPLLLLRTPVVKRNFL